MIHNDCRRAMLRFSNIGIDLPSSLGLGVDEKTCFIRIDNIRFESTFEIAFETTFEGGVPLSPLQCAAQSTVEC